MQNTTEYLDTLKKRSKESHVYREHQLVGLEIAETLGDEKHKSLYIKLAKNGNPEELRRLAKTVAENRNVKNKGAYFMSVLSRERDANLPARTYRRSVRAGEYHANAANKKRLISH